VGIAFAVSVEDLNVYLPKVIRIGWCTWKL